MRCCDHFLQVKHCPKNMLHGWVHRIPPDRICHILQDPNNVTHKSFSCFSPRVLFLLSPVLGKSTCNAHFLKPWNWNAPSRQRLSRLYVWSTDIDTMDSFSKTVTLFLVTSREDVSCFLFSFFLWQIVMFFSTLPCLNLYHTLRGCHRDNYFPYIIVSWNFKRKLQLSCKQQETEPAFPVVVRPVIAGAQSS